MQYSSLSYWAVIRKFLNSIGLKVGKIFGERKLSNLENELKSSWENWCVPSSKRRMKVLDAKVPDWRYRPRSNFVFCSFSTSFPLFIVQSFCGDWFIYQSIRMIKLFKSDDNKFHSLSFTLLSHSWVTRSEVKLSRVNIFTSERS